MRDREEQERPDGLQAAELREVQGGVPERPRTRPRIESPGYQIHTAGGTKS